MTDDLVGDLINANNGLREMGRRVEEAEMLFRSLVQELKGLLEARGHFVDKQSREGAAIIQGVGLALEKVEASDEAAKRARDRAEQARDSAEAEVARLAALLVEARASAERAEARLKFLESEHPDDEHPPRFWETVDDGDHCVACERDALRAALDDEKARAALAAGKGRVENCHGQHPVGECFWCDAHRYAAGKGSG